ncbi:MAG: hypothetical protein WCI04_00185 [archaeon]
MKKDRDIFLPDTTVKLSSLKRVLNEVYELDIIELNKMDKKMEGGTLNSSVMSFTQDDYNRLMDSNIFSSNKGERVFTIFPKGGGRHLAKYNPDKQYIFVIGKKDLSNPIVKWLSENSYISDNENYKLADGGTIDNQMENKLWYDIEKGIPHSFKYGGDIGYENYIVELKKGSETRRIGILAHSQQEAVSKAKKMIGKGYSTQGVFKYGLGGTLVFLGLGVANEYKVKLYKKGTLQDTYIFSEGYVDKATQDFKKLGYVVRVAKIKTMAEGGNIAVENAQIGKTYWKKNHKNKWTEYVFRGKDDSGNFLLETTETLYGIPKGSDYVLGKTFLYFNEPKHIKNSVYHLAKGGGVDNEVYIEFLNKDKGFKKDVKHFKSYEEAVKWARENFERFNPDMIKYQMAKGGSCGCGSKFEKGGNTNCGCWHYEIGGL